MDPLDIRKLSVLAHEGRMGVFRLLMRRYPDQVPAGDIAQALGIKASTLSVYLSALSGVGLVTQKRQATSRLYSISTASVNDLAAFLFNDCCRGRIAPLCFDEAPAPKLSYNVLFVCTGNSARSIFAEALLRDEGKGRFNVYSAGTKPQSELNPFAVEMLKSKGHDTSLLSSKTISVFQRPDAPAMDFVFTVCDQAANEECASCDSQPVSGHWGVPDPVKATGTDAEKRLAFQQAYGALKNRIKAFAALPLETLDRVALQAAVDDLARDGREEMT